MPQLKLLIAGVDKTAYLEVESVVRSAVTGHPIDTLSLTLLDHDGNLGTVTVWTQIVLEKYTDASVRYFGGIIAQSKERIYGLKRQVLLDCQDWTVLLARALILPKVYLQADYATDKLMIADAFTRAFTDPETQADLNDFDVTTYVYVGRPIARLVANRMALDQFLNVLGAHAIYEWYVDYFRNLHYYAVDYEVSTIHLSDAPDDVNTFAYSGLEKVVDGIELANLIEVTGGYVLGSADLEYLASDGVAVRLSTSAIWQALAGEFLPQVWRNDGTFAVPVWTQLTVFKEGDPNYTGGANQCTWNALQRMLIFGSAPPNIAKGAASGAVRVNGRWMQRINGRVTIPESFASIGRWVALKILDSNIFTQAEAQLRAEREALRRKFGVTSYKLHTQHDGFEVGKRVELTNAVLGLSAAEFVIERIVMRMLGGTTADYEMTLREAFNA